MHYGTIFKAENIFHSLTLNPLSPGAFCPKCIFEHFRTFQPQNGPNYFRSIQKDICDMTACFSIHEHYVLRQFWLGMRRNDEKVTYIFWLLGVLNLKCFKANIIYKWNLDNSKPSHFGAWSGCLIITQHNLVDSISNLVWEGPITNCYFQHWSIVQKFRIKMVWHTLSTSGGCNGN